MNREVTLQPNCSNEPIIQREAASDDTGERAPTAEVEVALKLWVVLARTYSALARHVDQDVARHGLTSMEFGILEVLHHKGPLLLGEIQRKILVTSGGITYLVDRLVEKGLVERQECPTDRRARYAVLTRAGSELIARIFPAHAAAITNALSGLSTAEQAQIAPLIRRLGLTAAELNKG